MAVYDRRTALIPPGRLGNLLAHRRDEWSDTLEDLARRSAHRFTVDDLARFERGDHPLEAADLAALGQLYHVRVGRHGLRRARLILDLEEATPPQTSDLGQDEVLGRYVALTELLRQVSPSLQLSGADLLVLSEALGLPLDMVARRLDADPAADPVVGLDDTSVWSVDAGFLVGPAAVGSLVLVPFPQPKVPALLRRLSWPAATVTPRRDRHIATSTA